MLRQVCESIFGLAQCFIQAHLILFMASVCPDIYFVQLISLMPRRETGTLTVPVDFMPTELLHTT
ncbi:MAG: hypothetical protein CO187_09575 [Zetaproteobacteria bacterium CG_4_9_14_3_um_filter_53_7]|nr:MAG: hypothetical protein CO187_09575 [Zetaproteobacteria bacterium CG_4_9_14_3_um_filter_53_7]